MEIKVKKLEWGKWSKTRGIQNSLNNEYTIHDIYIKNEDEKFLALSSFKKERVGFFGTLEQAKESCQTHYESFILSQIEVKG